MLLKFILYSLAKRYPNLKKNNSVLRKVNTIKINNYLIVVGGLDVEAAVCSEDRYQTQEYIGIEFYIAEVTLAPDTSTLDLGRHNIAVILMLCNMSAWYWARYSTRSSIQLNISAYCFTGQAKGRTCSKLQKPGLNLQSPMDRLWVTYWSRKKKVWYI